MTRDAFSHGRRETRHALLAVLSLLLAAGVSAPGTARAQAPSTGLATNFSANSGLPINIQADMLEVDDHKKIATFKGNVSAQQGDFKLRSRELVVSYSTGKADTAAPPGNTASTTVPGAGSGEINQIDAKGGVIITTKDNQEASGDLAVFLVKKQLVLLTGDVKVKQGGNIIACERVEANLATGITTMVPKDRVKAVFQTNRPDKQEKRQPATGGGGGLMGGNGGGGAGASAPEN